MLFEGQREGLEPSQQRRGLLCFMFGRRRRDVRSARPRRRSYPIHDLRPDLAALPEPVIRLRRPEREQDAQDASAQLEGRPQVQVFRFQECRVKREVLRSYRVGQTRHENRKKRVRHEVPLHPLEHARRRQVPQVQPPVRDGVARRRIQGVAVLVGVRGQPVEVGLLRPGRGIGRELVRGRRGLASRRAPRRRDEGVCCHE
mmetsp:Transcript_19186/g.54815  ORF Transcript_19186/g.54815 Transcript_19186/m.54815 type:complete len:201 (-) Transcript_19186:222-824(-)